MVFAIFALSQALFEYRKQKTYDEDHGKWNFYAKEMLNMISRCPSLEAGAWVFYKRVQDATLFCFRVP